MCLATAGDRFVDTNPRPHYNRADTYYLLIRRDQVTMFRLRTDHTRLYCHLYPKLLIGRTEQCPCGVGNQTTGRQLQSCPLYEPLRKGIWQGHTPVTGEGFRPEWHISTTTYSRYIPFWSETLVTLLTSSTAVRRIYSALEHCSQILDFPYGGREISDLSIARLSKHTTYSFTTVLPIPLRNMESTQARLNTLKEQDKGSQKQTSTVHF